MDLPGRGWNQLVVLSHLRWDWVWQRPQHLISRLAGDLTPWFVEEPRCAGAVTPRWREEDAGRVRRMHLEVPGDLPWVGFGHPDVMASAGELADRLGPSPARVVWLYTAMAWPLVEALDPDLVVFDVMDDLASFAVVEPALRTLHAEALARADVVITGGRSLHRGVTASRSWDVHCVPSGVEPEHFETAVAARPSTRPRPVAGYVGVIDERLDLELIEDVARRLDGWDLRMIGPCAKVDRVTLPDAPNLTWPGACDYEDLPAAMAGLDVALMPFAHNESTRSISPTKSLEYMAAGLPVVSTSVPDVVADLSGVVDIADGAEAFAAAVATARDRWTDSRRRAAAEVIGGRTWDALAHDIAAVLPHGPAAAPPVAGSEARRRAS